MKVGTDSVVLGAWADAAGCRSAIDIGAGSGLLSLMLAQRFPQLEIMAVEIDPGAALDAEANVARSPFASRIKVVCADALSADLPQCDLMISNPPFFTSTLKSPGASRAAARHESALGVASLANLASRLLTPVGSLAFVAPADRDGEIDLILSLARFVPWRSLVMRQRADRPVVRTFRQVSRSTKPPASHSLTVNNPDGSRTDEYSRLTADFYL